MKCYYIYGKANSFQFNRTLLLNAFKHFALDTYAWYLRFKHCCIRSTFCNRAKGRLRGESGGSCCTKYWNTETMGHGEARSSKGGSVSRRFAMVSTRRTRLSGQPVGRFVECARRLMHVVSLRGRREPQRATESHVAAATDRLHPDLPRSRLLPSVLLVSLSFASLSLSLSLCKCFLSRVDTLSGRARETEREERRMNRKRDESERRLWPVIHSSCPRKNLPLPSIRSRLCVTLYSSCVRASMSYTCCASYPRGTTRGRKKKFSFWSCQKVWQCCTEINCLIQFQF